VLYDVYFTQYFRQYVKNGKSGKIQKNTWSNVHVFKTQLYVSNSINISSI